MANKIINFAIKLVIRNEYDFLHEWFQYYMSMGFMNFIIYDDESNDGTKKLIDNYSKIINIHYNKINTSLRKHYDHVFNYKQYDYIFFFDIDEFLYISPNVDLIEFLNENYKNKNSVIQIPGIEVGNKENYKRHIYELECFKYNYLYKPGLEGNATLTVKSKDKIKTYFTKHIFSPKFSIYKSGHTSKPCKNYNIVSEFNKLDFTGKWFFKDKIDNILKYNIILFHFDTKNEYINNQKLKKHRFKCIHPNRKNNDMIIKKLNYLIIQNDIHINYSKKIIKNYFNKYGYYFISNFFDKKHIDKIYKEVQRIYKTQMLELNIINNKNISNEEFENSMKILFDGYFQIFKNCEKQCQHLISLWKLSLDEKLINYLNILGIKKPIISTRPVLFSNSTHISKNKINHTVPPHQDLVSMQGSINSIVIWIPLIDINQELDSIALVPKSHKEGLLSKEKEGSFGMVDKYKENDFISFNVKQGDIILFNSFLVHKYGNNITNNIRWSCHMR